MLAFLDPRRHRNDLATAQNGFATAPSALAVFHILTPFSLDARPLTARISNCFSTAPGTIQVIVTYWAKRSGVRAVLAPSLTTQIPTLPTLEATTAIFLHVLLWNLCLLVTDSRSLLGIQWRILWMMQYMNKTCEPSLP